MNIASPNDIFIAGFSCGAILYIPIGPNGIMALNCIKTMGYKGVVPTAMGSILSCFIVALIGSSILIFWGLDDNISHFLNRISGLFLMLVGAFFFRRANVRYETIKQKHEFNFRKSFLSAFLIGVSNPKGIIGFPMLFISLTDAKALSLPFSQVAIATLGATAGAVCWWLLFYFGFKFFEIGEKPFLLKNIVRSLSFLLILFGVLKLFQSSI